MEALIPIFRLLHFIGFALLFGGTLSSIILIKKEQPSFNSTRLSYTCMHAIAAPGLTILLLTGLLHSAIIYWDNFRGAGYMHLKVSLVFVLFILMIVDLKTQKKILSTSPALDVLVNMVKKRQACALSICLLTIGIMWLVSFRPF